MLVHLVIDGELLMQEGRAEAIALLHELCSPYVVKMSMGQEVAHGGETLGKEKLGQRFEFLGILGAAIKDPTGLLTGIIPYNVAVLLKKIEGKSASLNHSNRCFVNITLQKYAKNTRNARILKKNSKIVWPVT